MKAQETFDYNGKIYPDYIRQGDAVRHIIPFAQNFCKGQGLDIGGLREWSFPGAIVVNPAEPTSKFDAFNLPDLEPDYIFSSHCLEHIRDYIKALILWSKTLRHGGQLFLYLPHLDMEYWRPENCKKHLHQFTAKQIVRDLVDLGFKDIFHSERDLYWSFAVTGVRP